MVTMVMSAGRRDYLECAQVAGENVKDRLEKLGLLVQPLATRLVLGRQVSEDEADPHHQVLSTGGKKSLSGGHVTQPTAGLQSGGRCIKI